MPRSKTLKDVHGTDVHGANAHGTIVHGSPWGKTAVFSQSSDDGPLDADVDHNAAMKRLRERLRENRRNILTAVGNTGTNARVMIIESPTIHHGGETLEHVNVRIRVQTMRAPDQLQGIHLCSSVGPLETTSFLDSLARELSSPDRIWLDPDINQAEASTSRPGVDGNPIHSALEAAIWMSSDGAWVTRTDMWRNVTSEEAMRYLKEDLSTPIAVPARRRVSVWKRLVYGVNVTAPSQAELA
ncbi:MAG: hypothetical protein TREMPRED_003106 [Tremellales sp. Tagirdzhanova-0007]|nr:MAG: hypothetical protein TREMPRED_003106 [Tremellales sp. Tagirdzhanova-0007]